MELKLMFGDYEITITEEGNELSISAQRDGEVEEEFTLSKDGDDSQTKPDTGSEMKDFDEFEDEEESGDDEGDWDEDGEDWEGDESEDDEDQDDEDEDDEDEDDEGEDDEDDKMKPSSTGSKMVQGPKMGEPKLESFSSFLTRNKRK